MDEIRTHLDGNAAGGLLWDVFGHDVTTDHGTCAHCGRRGPMAETVVHTRGPGVIVRCRGCDGLLLVVVDRRGMRCVDRGGLAALEPAPRGTSGLEAP